MTKEFAHNAHEIGDCSCPALEAGFEVKDPEKRTVAQSQMYKIYDDIAHMEDGGYREVISEEKARAYWQEAINKTNHEKAAEFGRKVQEELGWDDQMEENE